MDGIGSQPGDGAVRDSPRFREKLPATVEYVAATGDTGVLDEPVSYLRGEELTRREEVHTAGSPAGAAAWTWRLAVEAILGVRRRDGALEVDP